MQEISEETHENRHFQKIMKTLESVGGLNTVSYSLSCKDTPLVFHSKNICVPIRNMGYLVKNYFTKRKIVSIHTLANFLSWL